MSSYQVDVFTRQALLGNGLTVFFDDGTFTADLMQLLTREMRQFESIFLTKTPNAHTYRASIFTMEEELDFAGHPLLGAACTLHYLEADLENTQKWIFQLKERNVEIITTRYPEWFEATMNQGQPQFTPPLPKAENGRYLEALNLEASDLADYPLQVISTGLPYLIVPLKKGIERAQIVNPKFETLLADIGAKFVYVFDLNTFEGRTWSNDGLSEDAATGSAAGPIGAYLVQHSLVAAGTEIMIQQGRFVNRPSQLKVVVQGTTSQIETVYVSGDVKIIAQGRFV